ncbi:MAG: hypothetical protein H6716_29140 [Polyangiaceae bacterium]|nr:hypothetical protein [Polyangiaceae bacterium]
MGLAAHNRDLPAYQAAPARACLSAGTEHHLERVVYGLVHMLAMDDRSPGGFAVMDRDGVRPIVLALVNEWMTELGRCNHERWEACRREDEARERTEGPYTYSREERARPRAERGDVWANETRTRFLVECVGLLHPGVTEGDGDHQ